MVLNQTLLQWQKESQAPTCLCLQQLLGEKSMKHLKGTEEYDYFRHVNTFGGNPAACALALKNLEIMENENLFERSRSSVKNCLNKT